MDQQLINFEDLPIGALTVKKFLELMNEAQNNSPTNKKEVKSNEEELLKLKDVLRLLKISRSTCFNWKKAGVLKGITIQGTLYFKRSQVMELFQSKNKLKK